MKRLYFLILLLTSAAVFAQETDVKWLNKNAINLDNYYEKLRKDLAGVTVLMLGEASHGTKEFYLEKNKIIQYLVNNDGYTQIGFEYLDTDFEKINDFIHGKAQHLPSAMKNLRAYRTKEFVELFQWLKAYNLKTHKNKVSVFGFHKEGFYDPFTRDQLMTDEVVKVKSATKAKVILWAHNIHTAKNKTMPEISVMGDYLRTAYGNQFFNIAFDTHEGRVTTMNWDENAGYTFATNELVPVEKESFTWLFNQVKYPNFYVRFVAGNPFSSQVKKITNVMVNWKAPFALPTTIGKDFDALIFIKKTSASQILTD
ncbi:MAG: hypothetical protein EOO47_07745 [Flavobacterium sp.]|nr:MAG: hypothetical protein EOO47_07745 [Flavobacterium sp.]